MGIPTGVDLLAAQFHVIGYDLRRPVNPPWPKDTPYRFAPAPVANRDNAHTPAALGLAVADAPVSCGVRRAVDGSLAIMTGGEEESVKRTMPLLQVLSKQIVHVGGHTRGLQVVRVHTARGWIVLASDASHYYENYARRSPFPIVIDVGDMLRGYERIEALADSPAHIIPGHDPLTMTQYQSAGPPELDIVSLVHPLQKQ